MKNTFTKTITWEQFRNVFGFVSDVMSVVGVTLLWLINSFIREDSSVVSIVINIPFWVLITLFSLSLVTFAIILVRGGYRRLVARRDFLFKFLYFTAVIPIVSFTLGFLFVGLNNLVLWLARWFFF